MLSVLIRVPPSHNHPLTELHPPPANQPCASLHQISINLQNRHKLKKIKLIKAVPVTYHERSLETKFQIAGSCPGLATFPWFSTYWLHEHYVSGLHREKLEIEIDRRKIEIRVELVCPWRSWGHWSLIWNISAYQHPFFCSRWRKYWKNICIYWDVQKNSFFEESLTHVRWRPPKSMVLITDTTSFFSRSYVVIGYI